jgi:hypothetical protein
VTPVPRLRRCDTGPTPPAPVLAEGHWQACWAWSAGLRVGPAQGTVLAAVSKSAGGISTARRRGETVGQGMVSPATWS